MGSRLVWPLIVLLIACGPSARNEDDDDDDQGGSIDAPPGTDDIDAPPSSSIDAGNAYPDAEPYGDGGNCSGWMCEDPVDDGCMVGTSDLCGNGADDNCNGMVDEGCTCQSGAVQSCFLGPPGKRNVGSCVDGMQTCTGSGEFTYWGPCEGGIRPTADACDTQDNDCNGCADDNPACCTVELSCPNDMPDGQPFDNYVIDGTQFYGGTVMTWQWTVSGGPCDQLFVSQGQPPSYTLTGANTSQLTFRPTLSGDYTVTVTMTLPDGTVYTCTFIVHIAGPGLRVEMCWDTAGDTDIDLHVHRPGTTTQWFGASILNPNNDDCYYLNCDGASATVNWGYPDSPLANCPPGSTVCNNPRLDIDNITTEGIPENINIDVPENGGTYRVMSHFYGASMATHPMVNIYCGGYMVATYGRAPDVVPNFDTAGSWGAGDMWRVVDVTPAVSNGDTTGCTLTPLHPPGQNTGYWVTTNDRSY